MSQTVRVGVEWINTWQAGGCQQGNLNYRDDHAQGFLAAMTVFGHTRVFDWGNDNAWETDFRHPSHGGDSLNWIDDVHFAFYSDHGGNWDNVMHVAFSKAHSYCMGASNQWQLGAKNLRWLVLDCCQGVLSADGGHIGAVWFPPWDKLHMLFGFIGNGHDGSYNAALGANFGIFAAAKKPLGNAWLDAAFSSSLHDVPIVIAAGATESEAVSRRELETIDWRDYPVTAANWLAYKWRS